MDRRRFLELSGGALFLLRGSRAQAAPSSNGGVLVVVFQRGAADGLHMVVPYRDSRYRGLRGSLALDEPGKGEGATLDLGDGFAFHPALAALYPLYREHRLAAVVNAGSPDPTRSHFDAQDYVESGTPGRKSTRDGWLGRSISALGGDSSNPFTGVSLTASVPRSLAGTRAVIALEDFGKLDPVGAGDRDLADRIEALYREDQDPEVSRAGEEAYRALRIFRGKDPLAAGGGPRYPKGRLAPRFRQLAQLIRAGLGIRVAFVESDGWDTHFAQGGAEGSMANSLRELAEAIAAFLEDVGSASVVTLLTVTEFGRTARINGALGTDHGHGSVMLAAGVGVRGGRVLGDWLSLDSSNLFEGRDLPVTTDFRDVFQEVAAGALGIARPFELFPGYRPSPVGVMASLRATGG